jgi:hypothetical protein
VRDDIVRFEPEARQRSPDRLVRVRDRPHDEVRRIARHGIRTLARHDHLEAVAGQGRDHELVVDAQRQAERVEARPEVRAGRRHSDGDRAPSDRLRSPAQDG